MATISKPGESLGTYVDTVITPGRSNEQLEEAESDGDLRLGVSLDEDIGPCPLPTPSFALLC
jgi:hypothetical protein